MNSTFLITGTSSGLGRATARLFHARGRNVVATMRTPERETELTQLDQYHPGARAAGTKPATGVTGSSVAEAVTPGRALQSVEAPCDKNLIIGWPPTKPSQGRVGGGQPTAHNFRLCPAAVPIVVIAIVRTSSLETYASSISFTRSAADREGGREVK